MKMTSNFNDKQQNCDEIKEQSTETRKTSFSLSEN